MASSSLPLGGGPLVSASWLHQHLSRPDIRIIDCRHRFDDPSYGERSYLSAHIPGAVYFGLKSHLVGTEGDGRSPIPSGVEFAERAGRAGIGADDLVVCYDDGLGGVAARAWWLFRHFGHEKVFVLRDGFSSWTYPTQSGQPAKTALAEFPLRAPLTSIVRSADVLAVLGTKDTAIIDARAPARFRGEAPPLDAIEGHIPGALNIPADALAESLLLRRCTANATRVIAYCGPGIIACNIALACSALGRDDVQLYAVRGATGRRAAFRLSRARRPGLFNFMMEVLEMTRRTSPEESAFTSLISRRSLLQGAAAAGIAAGLPWSGALRAAEIKRGGHLVAGIAGGSTTDTLDPESFNDTYMVVVGSSTRDNLTEIAANGSLRPALAESWEPSKDARTWTFRLRKGVKFSNGKSLDSQDVVDSINAHRREDSKSGVKANLTDIETIAADGKDMVIVKLSSGNADFPYLLTDFHLNILPSKDGKPDWASKAGTGAYILEEFNPGVRSLLKLNPNRWDQESGFVESAELLHINDVAARQAGLISGELQVVNRIDLKTAGRLKANSAVRILDVPSLAHHTIPMMVDAAPFDNKDVRLALKYAIDREEYVAKILMGFGRIGNDQPIGPGSTYRFHADDVPQHAYDPDKARFHLKKAGLDSLNIDLHTSDGAFTGAVDAAILYQESALKAGINLNVIREPNDGYFSDIWPKTAFRFCWWSQRATEDQMLSVNYAANAAWNDTHWKNERFEKFLHEARSELDDAKRAQMYREMQMIVSDDAGTIIPAFINNVHGVAAAVGTGADISSSWELDGGHFVKRWWLT